MPSTNPRTRSRGRRGFSIVEFALLMAILVLAVGILSRTVVATSLQRAINRERALAAEAGKVVIESMRNAEFEEVWALYNPDTLDDPLGPGSAPGNRFPVLGLTSSAPDGMVGEVFFPAMSPAEQQAESGLPAATWALREDVEDDNLGLPRDLNGDSKIDAEDHGADYILLPVTVQLEWQGRLGVRRLAMHTMLTEFKK